MGYLSERVSYLRGLADGLNISDDTNEGKLLKVIIDVLDDVAISVEEVEDEQKALLDDIDELDERLADAEDCIYDDCDCDCDCDDDDDDCCCCDCEDDDFEYNDLECPNCGCEIELDSAIVDEEKSVLICPECHNEIEIEWLDDDEECCCGCCDCEE
ncbi:MAG: hypothetical protein E7387_02900 [Ruminococcaceae bacterium]|nr:hypothetical protein [Oscillospiraceae bacterium]